MLEQTCAPLCVGRLQRGILVATLKKEPTRLPYLKAKRDVLPQCGTAPPNISGCAPVVTPCPESQGFVGPSRSSGVSLLTPLTPAASQGQLQAAFLISAMSV